MAETRVNELIYVFLYQNLNAIKTRFMSPVIIIYVFLYQNLNKKEIVREASIKNNLCISILEFKY